MGNRRRHYAVVMHHQARFRAAPMVRFHRRRAAEAHMAEEARQWRADGHRVSGSARRGYYEIRQQPPQPGVFLSICLVEQGARACDATCLEFADVARS